MHHYTKPALKKKPDTIIIHAGTNNVKNLKPKDIQKRLSDLCLKVKEQNPSTRVVLSELITRNDKKEYTEKIEQVNKCLKNFCSYNGIDLIEHKNIEVNCLNKGGLHLNKRGSSILASNFRNYIRDTRNLDNDN